MKFNLKNKNDLTLNISEYNKLLFIMLGCGGVNSHLACDLSQICSLSSKTTDIIIIDNNNVDKNTLLQEKFLKSDMGLNKAYVTASRCSAAFNLNIQTMEEEIQGQSNLLSVLNEKNGYYPIVIMDNVSKRQRASVKGMIKNIANIMVFDSVVNNSIGTLEITSKKDGITETTNHIEEANSKSYTIQKDTCVEVAKNIFLYADDILCDRDITTEKLVTDMTQKSTRAFKIKKSASEDSAVLGDGIVATDNDKILAIIVGIGGTGGSLAYDMAHIASTSNKDIKLVFIDGDWVEIKNLNRQRFIYDDLNMNKALVTAKRCAMAYDIDIQTKEDYVDSEKDIYKLLRENKDRYPIILGCSDSLKLRHLFCETIRNMSNQKDLSQNISYIDAGNGTDSGQSICTIIKNGEYLTKDFFEEFPQNIEDLETAKLVTQLSCDELMNSAPQTKGANMSASASIYSYAQDIINQKPIYKYLTQFNNKSRRVESKGI